jgi:hypothetical protein
MGALRRGRLVRAGATAAALAALATAGFTAGTASAATATKAEKTQLTVLAAPAYTPPARTLKEGMKGADVKALQQRLAALKYYPGAADGTFGANTLEAVVNPRAWKPRDPRQNGTRVEVNLTLRVLALYINHRVALISHVSSGGGYYYCSNGGCSYAITPTGNFRTTVYMPGWVKVPLGEMYNPVFFISTVFAIHGDTYVPVNPVSHGCIRIPMDIAAFFHTMVKTPGTEVFVYK